MKNKASKFYKIQMLIKSKNISQTFSFFQATLFWGNARELREGNKNVDLLIAIRAMRTA